MNTASITASELVRVYIGLGTANFYPTVLEWVILMTMFVFVSTDKKI